MITLYGNPYSSNSRKIHWALEEMGAPYRYQHVDIPKREQKTPEYLKLNPNGRVPTLDEDGFLLWESNAILWYLADKLGRGTLVPEDVRERALVDQWMWWQYSDLSPAMGRPWIHKFYSRFGRPYDEAKQQHLIEEAKKPLALLDAHLAGKQYVVAERFSIADIALAEFVGLADVAMVDLSPFPNLQAWMGRLGERPAFGKTRPKPL